MHDVLLITRADTYGIRGYHTEWLHHYARLEAATHTRNKSCCSAERSTSGPRLGWGVHYKLAFNQRHDTRNHQIYPLAHLHTSVFRPEHAGNTQLSVAQLTGTSRA